MKKFNLVGFIFASVFMLALTMQAADTKISALTALTEANIASDDELVIVDTGASVTKRITFTEFDKRFSTKDVADGNILIGNGSGASVSVDPSTWKSDVDVNNLGQFSISSGVIVNADVSTGAAIAYNKLAALTASRALVSSAGGAVEVATTTAAEIGYVNGLTSAIQTQIDSKGAKVQAADALQHFGLVRAEYAFGTDGGTVGDIGLGQTLPDNSKVHYCNIEVTTALESAGGAGTIAIRAESANDILSAIDADTLTTGFNDGVPDWAAANMFKTSSAKQIIATVAVEDLTAGVLLVDCAYSIGD